MNGHISKSWTVARQLLASSFAKNIGFGIFIAVLAVLAVITGLAVVAGLVFGFMAIPALIGMLLWNHALAPFFGAPLVTFWVAFAIVWVLSILGSLLRRK